MKTTKFLVSEIILITIVSVVAAVFYFADFTITQNLKDLMEYKCLTAEEVEDCIITHNVPYVSRYPSVQIYRFDIKVLEENKYKEKVKEVYKDGKRKLVVTPKVWFRYYWDLYFGKGNTIYEFADQNYINTMGFIYEPSNGKYSYSYNRDDYMVYDNERQALWRVREIERYMEKIEKEINKKQEIKFRSYENDYYENLERAANEAIEEASRIQAAN